MWVIIYEFKRTPPPDPPDAFWWAVGIGFWIAAAVGVKEIIGAVIGG